MQTFDPDKIKYTYSPEHAPIGTVEAGESFTVTTADGFTGRYDDPADFTPETAAWVEEDLDGVTGPIAVAGAEPGQAIAVTIEELEVITKPVVVVSRCEALSPYDWWHEEDHVVNLTVADGLIRLRDDWTVPATPLIGCLATTPARETVFSKHEGDHGGNLDVREITAGSTIVLPVEIPGAGLYFGDCKAALGDGEIVCAPECGTRIVVTARPFERPHAMGAPRIVTADRLMTVVSAPSRDGRGEDGFPRAQALARAGVGADERRGGDGDGHRRALRHRPGDQPAAHGEVLDRSIAAAAGCGSAQDAPGSTQ